MVIMMNYLCQQCLNDMCSGMFEQRVMEHHEEREKNTLLYLKNYKGINKKVKTLGEYCCSFLFLNFEFSQLWRMFIGVKTKS